MESLPGRVFDMPYNDKIQGMVIKRECQYLFWIARERQNEDGVVAEVGSWLGLSAWHLAMGADATIHCFDDFRWRLAFAAKSEIELPNDACFQHVFDENLKATKAISHKVSISDLNWNLGEISILHIDSAKRAPEISRLLTEVGDFLRPGSILIFQDFCHEMSHDLPFAAALLNEYLEPLHTLNSCMVSFRVRKPIPAHAVDLERLSPSSYSYLEIVSIWSDLLQTFGGSDHRRLTASLAFLLDYRGFHWAVLRQIISSGFDRETVKRFYSPAKFFQYPSIFLAYGYWPTIEMLKKEHRKRKARNMKLQRHAS